MKMSIGDLRLVIREVLNEDLKNVYSAHEDTVAGHAALKKMHDSPAVMKALSKIDDPREIAHVIEAELDAMPVVSRATVEKALNIVRRHERKNRR